MIHAIVRAGQIALGTLMGPPNNIWGWPWAVSKWILGRSGILAEAWKCERDKEELKVKGEGEEKRKSSDGILEELEICYVFGVKLGRGCRKHGWRSEQVLSHADVRRDSWGLRRLRIRWSWFSFAGLIFSRTWVNHFWASFSLYNGHMPTL